MSIHQIHHYISIHHTSSFALAGGAVCALVTVELALRTLNNLWQVLTNDHASHHREFNRELFSNIGGMVLMGACASNAIPGLAAAAGALFVAHALIEPDCRNALVTTKVVRSFKRFVEDFVNTPEILAAVVVIGLIALYKRA